MAQIKHGTQTAYVKHKCRCTECRAWKAGKERAYRDRRRSREGRDRTPITTVAPERHPVGSMLRVPEFNRPSGGTWLPMDEGRHLEAIRYPEFVEFIEAEYGTVGRWVDVPVRRSTDPSKRWFMRVR